MRAWLLGLFLLTGCTTTDLPLTTSDFSYTFCKPGIGGEWRVATGKDANGNAESLLVLFSVGGPYDIEHVLCVISGDHAILDLGKGQQS